jgi:hypothetical protein
MMTPVNNNNKPIHDEEHQGGQEVEAALPPPTEMAVSHPPEETDEPSGRTNRRYRRRFSRNQALAALAALAFVVGTATVISRAASGKTSSINSSMQQAAVTGTATTVFPTTTVPPPPKIDGYTYVGPAFCRDENDLNYNYLQYNGDCTTDDLACANKCDLQCIKDVPTVTLRGFTRQGSTCYCWIDGPLYDLGPLSKSCPNPDGFASSRSGAGPIEGVGGSTATCYKVKNNSKASKAPKAAKRG